MAEFWHAVLWALGIVAFLGWVRLCNAGQPRRLGLTGHLQMGEISRRYRNGEITMDEAMQEYHRLTGQDHG